MFKPRMTSHTSPYLFRNFSWFYYSSYL